MLGRTLVGYAKPRCHGCCRVAPVGTVVMVEAHRERTFLFPNHFGSNTDLV